MAGQPNHAVIELFSQFQYPTPPLNRLDTTRIFAELYRRVGEDAGLLDRSAVDEAAAEFEDEDDDNGEDR